MFFLKSRFVTVKKAFNKMLYNLESIFKEQKEILGCRLKKYRKTMSIEYPFMTLVLSIKPIKIT